MLKLFKKPEDYINYGVWLIPTNRNYTEKRKIIEVKTHLIKGRIPSYTVTKVRVEHDNNWYLPSNLFMSKKDCMEASKDKFITEIEKLQREIEYYEFHVKSNMHSIKIAKEKIESIKSNLEKIK